MDNAAPSIKDEEIQEIVFIPYAEEIGIVVAFVLAFIILFGVIFIFYKIYIYFFSL